MLRLGKALWNDECGSVVCAEAVLLVTLGVVAASVGVSTTAKSIGGELRNIALAFRSLDQSYCYQGFRSCDAATAGSAFQQEPVERSLKELRDYERDLERLRQRALKRELDRRREKRPHRRFDDDDD